MPASQSCRGDLTTAPRTARAGRECGYLHVNVTMARPAAGNSCPVSILVTLMLFPMLSHYLLALVSAICCAPKIPHVRVKPRPRSDTCRRPSSPRRRSSRTDGYGRNGERKGYSHSLSLPSRGHPTRGRTCRQSTPRQGCDDSLFPAERARYALARTTELQ